MTTYEKIILLLRCWKIPIIKDKDWDYASCIYWKDWYIFASDWQHDIYDVYNSNWYIWNKEEVEKYKREIVRIDTPERHIFKKWDIVDLDIEALKKTNDWEDYKEDFWDYKNLEIKNICNNISWLYYDIYIKDKSDNCSIWAEYVLPNTEDNTKKIELSDEQLLEEARKRGLIKSWEVVK